MRILLTGLVAIAALTMPVRAANEDEVKSAEKAWAQAVTAHDYPALDKIFAPGLIYAHSTGAIESKDDYLKRLKTGAQKYDAIEQENIKIVDYGDAAVTHSILRMRGTSNGKPFNDHVMVLHAWVKKNGAWKLAGHQSTKLAQ